MQVSSSPEHERFMREAWAEANNAKCKKAHFGAVIVKDGKIVTKGHNAPADGNECAKCPREQIHRGHSLELCYAVHAKQNALLQALRERKDVSGSTMYIGHIRNGEIQKFVGKPSCTLCSRLIAVSGVKDVVLYRGDDYAVFGAAEFNKASFENIMAEKGL